MRHLKGYDLLIVRHVYYHYKKKEIVSMIQFHKRSSELHYNKRQLLYNTKAEKAGVFLVQIILKKDKSKPVFAQTCQKWLQGKWS